MQKLLSIALGALLLTIAACAAGIERVRGAEARMAGAPALELRRCLGPPEAFEVYGPDEIARFRWVRKEPREPVLTFQDSGQVRGMVTPRVTCQYLVHLRGRRIEALRVRGRTADGLNVDATCAEDLERCLDRSAR